jgi:hypothetical protein
MDEAERIDVIEQIEDFLDRLRAIRANLLSERELNDHEKDFLMSCGID